jgi:hypothetical protein
MEWIESIDRYFERLNNNSFIIGIMILITNLGSKYISLELSKTQEQFLQSDIMRKFLIFAICFLATRKLVTSFLLTGAFTAIVSGLFHEDSRYCLLPEKFTNKEDADVPSEKEVQKARETLEKYDNYKTKQYESDINKQLVASGLTVQQISKMLAGK